MNVCKKKRLKEKSYLGKWDMKVTSEENRQIKENKKEWKQYNGTSKRI